MHHTTPSIADQVKFEIAYRTAIVAALFVAAVCILLLFAYGQRMTQDPFEDAEFVRVRSAVMQEPEDADAVADLRTLDLELRREYFAQRKFASWGGFLLVAGAIVALAAGRWAAALRRPMPDPLVRSAAGDLDERISRIGRWAVAALALVIVVSAVTAAVGLKSDLPGSLSELAAKYPAAPLPADNGSKVGTDGATRNGGEPAPDGNAAARATNGNGGHTATPNPDGSQLPIGPAESDYPSLEELQANWPRFRGYQGAGISLFEDPPLEWDAASGKGIVWKTAVPLPGNSSPIVWQDRVFVTGATEEKREVYCFAAETGELLWQYEAEGTPESTATPLEVMEDTGYAAPTAVTDGHGVFAMFANGDVVAVDFDGRLRWARSLGIPVNSYGHASSLAMYRDRVIIQYDQGTKKDDKSRLLALSAATGATVWQVTREVANSWPSPIVMEHDGVWQVITCSDPWVLANAAEDGRELWRAKLLQYDVGPSPVYHGGDVYVVSEQSPLSVIRAGGSGDVTESHLKWEAEDGLPDCCSPLVTDDFVLLLPSSSTLTCYDAKTGNPDPLWEEDLDGRFVSSPSIAAGHVYLFGDKGKALIVKLTVEQCQRIAENDLGEACVTSPAFQNGRLYIRGKQHLFCIGK